MHASTEEIGATTSVLPTKKLRVDHPSTTIHSHNRVKVLDNAALRRRCIGIIAKVGSMQHSRLPAFSRCETMLDDTDSVPAPRDASHRLIYSLVDGVSIRRIGL